ncbi:hypothetical protein Tco_0630730 [Tanacetum coccineum]
MIIGMNSMMSSKNLGMKMVYLMKLGIIFANLSISKMGELNEDGFCNGGELPGMVRVGYMAYFQDHEWYNDLMDGSSKDEALEQKAIYEESWGDAKQSVINFCRWLKKTFGNFHELDYGLLEKIQDYWWKVNEHECSPFANWKNYIRGPYANYYSNFLDVMEHEEEERCEVFDNHERPVCYIRIFEMVKYSFRDDEECVAIKEKEYDDLINTSKDAIHAYQEIFRMMDEKWMNPLDKGLGEDDASKQGRITDIDANEDIYLVNVHTDEDMFGVNDLDGDEVIVESVDVVNIVEETRSVVEQVTAVTIPVSVATTTTTTTAITDVEMTLAQALAELKSAKPKANKVVIQEPEQGTTTPTLTITTVAITITTISTRPKAKRLVIHE